MHAADEPNKVPTTARRRFLKSIAAGGLVLPACNQATFEKQITPSSGRFPQSVASGDPTPSTVILWTRVAAEGAATANLLLQLSKSGTFEQFVELDNSAQLLLQTSESSDHCARVRLTGLEADTIYYYRFLYDAGERLEGSRVGRTKTAPAADSERDVRFAVMSCQDFIGRYYHSQQRASELDLDLVVFLGDYIYESAGNANFQSPGGDRDLSFDDSEGALSIANTELRAEDSEPQFLAAKSLDNYRQLYRTVRSDASLQRLHERFPFVMIWDDHEYSNDCFGESGTYTNARADERSGERRTNADQAWVEYMPIDYPDDPAFEFDRDAAFPENLRIYRELTFGRHLHLVMTDLRRYRPDHVIPEDALPGAIAVTQPQLLQSHEELPELAVPYLDLELFKNGEVQDMLREALGSRDSTPEWVTSKLTGNVSLEFVNRLLAELGRAELMLTPDELDSLPRGVSYELANKNEQFSSTGSRLLVGLDAFQLIAAQRYAETAGESENLMGSKQERWFLDTLKTSQSTWKVWGNAYVLMKRNADLRSLPVPQPLRKKLFLSADDWDGAPNRRHMLLGELEAMSNIVVVTGDLHTFFAGYPGVSESERVVEFVCGSLTSATLQSLLASGGAAVEGLDDFGGVASLLLEALNPHMAYNDLTANGFAVVTASADELLVTYHALSSEKVHHPTLEDPLASHFSETTFRVHSNTGTLQRQAEDGWKTWDRSEKSWV